MSLIKQTKIDGLVGVLRKKIMWRTKVLDFVCGYFFEYYSQKMIAAKKKKATTTTSGQLKDQNIKNP